ncbi:hypothetical protein SteCoe_18759 [Stentor coeruleus]|uniref:Uncharacterized protein n=1 Tax=Stentor coeruleus TaxID=5963 RepID=A0A1R2BVV4_9CILI|nr:hypothetical protein SteCoe_18759 [Stentor coeruleus]
MKDLELLSKLDSFTPEKVGTIINSLSKIYSLSNRNNFVANKSQYNAVLSTLPQNLIILVPKLESEPFFNIFSLVRKLKIIDSALLESFSKTFLSSHLENATLPNIVEFLSGYDFNQEKNTELWCSIEKKIDELVYRKEGSIPFPDLKTVIKCFADSNRGNRSFREKLLENLIGDLNSCSIEFSADIAIALEKIGIKNKAYIGPFFDHVVKHIGSGNNLQYHKLIPACIRLNAGNKNLLELENHAKNKLKEISLRNMNNYISVYKDFAKGMDDINEDRILFLEQLENVYEEVYNKNFELAESEDGIPIHIRALSLFLRVGVVKNHKFWTKVFKDIQIFSLCNQNKILWKLIRSIEASQWAKQNR